MPDWPRIGSAVSKASDWQRIIAANMEPLEMPGRDPLYKPKGEQATVWVITAACELPPSSPTMDRLAMGPGGGREVDLDASDPQFLIVHKIMGMMEYTHAIPWDKIVDIIFCKVPE